MSIDRETSAKRTAVSICRSWRTLILLGAGLIVSVALQLYLFEVDSANGQKSRSTSEGRANSGASRSPIVTHRAAAFLLAGLLVPLFAQKTPWCAAFGFAAGVGAAFTALSMRPPLSNLWPIVIIMMVSITAGPAFLGSSVTAILLSRYRRRA